MKKVLIQILRWIRNILLFLFSISLFFVILYRYIPVYYTTEMMVDSIEQLFRKEKNKIEHEWKSLSEISPSLVNAVIASEDFLFLIHNGFDTDKENINLNKGARNLYLDNRTISQQTARSVFLLPGDSYFNELLDTYFTILIEFVWGKKKIIEIYLNSIEVGKSVYGAEAIARTYFNKPALDLTDQEASLIAACLINPEELEPQHPTIYILRRQAKILGIMEELITIEW
ncbi:MAG: transglycosylase domain-containing protein [Bacteroidales bacterium]|nr:transglycosylase domain-containing protein [Bacteroidales bacterium]